MRLFKIFLVMFFLSGTICAGEITIGLRGNYFSPSEKAFQDIYGGGMRFEGELTFSIWKNLQLWIGGNYFSQNGELTFTKEETSLQIIPIGGGIKYRYLAGKIGIYGGVGLNYYLYKESNILGEVREGGLGFVGKIGVTVTVIKGLFLDLFGEYSYCKMTPDDFTINIGGMAAGIGLGYKF